MRKLTHAEYQTREWISRCIYLPILSLGRFYLIGTGERDRGADDSLIRGRAERAKALTVSPVRSTRA